MSIYMLSDKAERQSTCDLGPLGSDKCCGFDHVKDRIGFALINPNSQLLERIAWISFLDLAVTFYVLPEQDKDSDHIQFINDWDLQAWGISIDWLYGLAITNMPRMLPVTQVTMAELGRSLGDVGNGKEVSPFCILGNASGIYGAASMLYPNILRLQAEKYDRDILILPLSVKTIMTIPDCNGIPYEEWNQLILKMSIHVPNNEALTRHPYLYNKKSGQIEIVGKEENGGDRIR